MTDGPTYGEELDFLGARARVLEQGGELGVVEMHTWPGHMTPLHVHHAQDEAEQFVIEVAAMDGVDPEAFTAAAEKFDPEILGPPGAKP